MLVALTFVSAFAPPTVAARSRGRLDFSITEDPHARRQSYGAACALMFGAGPPRCSSPPVCSRACWGRRGGRPRPADLLAVLILAEFMLIDWRRIPYACTYLPGTHVLAYHLGVLFAKYFIFVIIGSNLIVAWRAVAVAGAWRLLIAGVGRAEARAMEDLGTAAAGIRRRRPGEVRGLRL